MYKNYLKIAFRNIVRHKAFTFINVSGLAIGLACCLMILVFVRAQTAYDQYHENKDRLYRLTLKVEGLKSGNIWHSATSSILWAPQLQKDYPEIVAFCRVMDEFGARTMRIGDATYEEERTVVADASALELFTWPLISGDPATALDEPYSVVINESTARKYFGEESPIGKIIQSDEEQESGTRTVQFKVTGVMRDIPYKSHLKPDLVFSFVTLNDYFGADVHSGAAPSDWYWRGRLVHNYLLLRDDASPARLEAKFPEFLDKYVGDATVSRGYDYHPYLQPVANIHLEGDVASIFEPGGDLEQIYLFAAIALFILLIACINFMNLSTARSVYRSKEVGVRKVVGANRKKLIRQFLGESLFLSFLALLLGLLLIEVFNPVFYSYVGYEYYFDPGDLPLFALGIVGITFLVGLISGSYPAFVLSGFQPVKVLGGRFRGMGRGAYLRKALVVFQFAITVFFIVATLTVNAQLRFMRDRDLGFKESQVVVLPPEVTRPLLPQIEAHRNELLSESTIQKMTLSSGIPGRSFGGDVWVERGKSGDEGLGVNEFGVDYDYIDFYELNLIAGRNFSREMGTDAPPADIDSSGYVIAAIVNEALVKRFGWASPEDALGRLLVRDPASNDFTGKVIGVIEDFHYTSLHSEIEPMIMFINPNYSSTYRYLSMEIAPQNMSEGIATVRAKFESLGPETTFDYFFLDEDFARQYEQDTKMLEVYSYASGLAIFIACLGLFGLASFSAERRAKEIGVRKVLGASVTGIVGLLSSEFIKLVALANLIAWPLDYFIMKQWLEDYAYRLTLGPGLFLTAGIIAFAVALLTVSYQATRAALLNPVETLKYE